MPDQAEKTVNGSRWKQTLGGVAADSFLVNFSVLLAFELVYQFEIPSAVWTRISFYCAGLTLLSIIAFAKSGVYRVEPRYLGLPDCLKLAYISLGLGLLLLFMESAPGAGRDFKPAIPVLFSLLCAALLIGRRVGQRMYAWRTSQSGDGRPIRRTIVVGAGDAGDMILREISKSPMPQHHVVGLVDDDPAKQSASIRGCPVIGRTDDLARLVREKGIEEILIAIPSAKGAEIRRIFEICRHTGARVRLLPAIPSIIQGAAHLDQFREVQIEDLLNREPVTLNWSEVKSQISGERVLITGGGGSIGSELARQIVEMSPATLILLGKGENSLYEIEQELIATVGFRPTVVVADVKDATRMEQVFRRERPTVIFHAAAHKHVPLMESNPSEAIKNNIQGTSVTAELAIRYGVRKFIYVSTDKAVNPSSMMGATKRVGEMIIAALAGMDETEFAIVRFGNVLGSRGSVIPTMKAQIARGGPVRITHKDMTRFFMTIPEAVQLIIQASALGKNGEIFTLDMGEPVKIYDLAVDLIRMHGLVPDEDVKLEFTGVRPGEKMHEELYDSREHVIKTSYPKINMTLNNAPIDLELLRGEIDTLVNLCDADQTDRAREFLMELAWGKRVIQANRPV